MSTIDDQQLTREVDAAGPTVRQAHQGVRVARLNHCRHGRAHVAHRMRVRRPHVSQYRAVAVLGATAATQTTRTNVGRKYPPLFTVATGSVVLTLLYVVVVQAFEPDLNNKALAVGVYLIAATAAVCLNAFTVGAMTPPGPHPKGAVPGVQQQGKARLLTVTEPKSLEEQR